MGITFMDIVPDGLAVILGFSAGLYLIVNPLIDDFKAVGAFLGMFASLGIQVYKLIEVKRIRREVDALKNTKEEHTTFFDGRLKQLEKKLENHE